MNIMKEMIYMIVDFFIGLFSSILQLLADALSFVINPFLSLIQQAENYDNSIEDETGEIINPEMEDYTHEIINPTNFEYPEEEKYSVIRTHPYVNIPDPINEPFVAERG